MVIVISVEIVGNILFFSRNFLAVCEREGLDCIQDYLIVGLEGDI